MVTPSRTYLTVEVKPEKVSSKTGSSLHPSSASSSSSSANMTPPASPGKQVRFKTHTTTTPAPSTTTPPPSPGKSVRFVHAVSSEPRDLTIAEQWSLYYFEQHARTCETCYNPYSTVHGHRFCSKGHALAMDVGVFIRLVDGVACSVQKENGKTVQVKLPANYSQVAPMLVLMHEASRRNHRLSRSYTDDAYASTSRRRSPEGFVESSSKSRNVGKKSRSPSPTTPSHTIRSEIPHIVPPTTTLRRGMSERRHSVYESGRTSPRQAYVVEIREPLLKEHKRSRDSRRSSVFLF